MKRKNKYTETMKKLVYFTVIATIGLLVASCSKGDEIKTYEQQQIGFTQSVGQTRGTLIGSTGIVPSIDIAAYKGATEYISLRSLTPTNATNTAWKFTPIQFWPTDGSELSFFAMSPTQVDGAGASDGISNVAITSTSLTLDYAAPSSALEQPDLLVAYTTGSADNSLTAHLEFGHALASVGFSVKGHESKRITAISISNVSSSGKLTFDNAKAITWSDLSAATTTVNAGVDSSITPSDMNQIVTAENGYLIMVPQTVATTSVVSVTTTNADGTNAKTSEINFPEAQQWRAGVTHIYIIEVDGDGIAMLFDITASPWNEEPGVLGNDYD